MQPIRWSSYKFGSQLLSLLDTESLVVLINRVLGPGAVAGIVHETMQISAAQWRDQDRSETEPQPWALVLGDWSEEKTPLRAGAIAQAFWSDSAVGFWRLVNLGRVQDVAVDEWMLEQPQIRTAILGLQESMLFGQGSPAAGKTDARGVARI